jgi:DNA replication and repair protein RecF
MHVTKISLENFRNYRELELSLPPGPTLLYGNNAQGKTNLLESLYFLATTRSPHAHRSRQLINWEKMDSGELIVVGRIVARLETKTGTLDLEMRLIRESQKGKHGFRREALITRRKVRLMDLIGKLRVVLFVPQDMDVITGSPSVRRRYLDIALCQSDPDYCRTLSQYNKVLEQRNALLRQIAEEGTGRDVLPVYTDKLADVGGRIFLSRAQALNSLDEMARNLHYSQLTGGSETLQLSYFPRFAPTKNNQHHRLSEFGDFLAQQPDIGEVVDSFGQALEKAQNAEISSGLTLVGPHRDDWRFMVDEKDLSFYGSRGQQRTALLALKLAELQWMSEQTGETPILLLDEVVAELDKRRRDLLLSAVTTVSQSILTATDPSMFSEVFLTLAASMRVSEGKVFQEKTDLNYSD